MSGRTNTCHLGKCANNDESFIRIARCRTRTCASSRLPTYSFPHELLRSLYSFAASNLVLGLANVTKQASLWKLRDKGFCFAYIGYEVHYHGTFCFFLLLSLRFHLSHRVLVITYQTHAAFSTIQHLFSINVNTP